MDKLRCILGRQDDLHDFAESFLSSVPFGRLNAGVEMAMEFGGVQTGILHRDGAYQVEIVVVGPGVYIPPHVHPDADSIEYPVSGFLRFVLNGRDPFGKWSDAQVQRASAGKGLRIERDCVHGGTAGAAGAMFLSLQRWHIAPRHIGQNWRGATVSRVHDARL